ncbi:acetate--CoA ligase family protein [Streptomyces sp. NPDC032161]|uniref:acetate--CoA ligase family protein n=1 Tax=unclassified Streptomyces TaxID=2593676 RepID=UPI0033D2AD7C
MTTTTTPELATSLYAPRSIALIGASADPLKASSRPLGFLRESGYAGAVYPINRRGGTVGGQPVYQSLEELPEVPEHAFVMTPTASVLDTVVACGRAGVKVATILSGGFAEVGEEGAARQDEVLKAARTLGIRLLGPNSLGIANPHNGLLLTANAAFAEPDLPHGGLFVASQSGSMIGALLSRGAAKGIGFSRLVSVGAEMDLSIGELCSATLDDDAVTGYLLFLETTRHPEDLRRFAQGAAERGKPVIAYKLGRSDMAAQLAASHTGALAGEDDVATAFLADLGIPRVNTLDGLLEAVPLVGKTAAASVGRPRRVGVVTTTGGGAAMVVDQLGLASIKVAGASEETLRRMSDAGAVAEPGLITDLTLAGTRPDVMGAALEVLSTAPEFDLLLAVVGSSARHAPELAVAPIIEVAKSGNGHPIAAFIVPDAPAAHGMLTAAGVPAFRSPESCADGIAAALNRRPARPGHLAVSGAESTVLADEAESYSVLAAAGVPVTPHWVVNLGDLAVNRLPTEVTYPVAVKALSDRLAHKSDVGGVALGVTSPDELVATAERIRSDVARLADVTIEQVLVQEMASGIGEVLVGYRIDPHCGPLVLVAAGGTLAEVYADRSIRMAPVDFATAHDMLEEIVALKSLRGFRGAPPGDLGALADVVVRMSQLAHHADVVEAEVNPLLVRAHGEGVTAVDGVVRFRAESVPNDDAKKEGRAAHA